MSEEVYREVSGARCQDCRWWVTGDMLIEAEAQKHANQEGHAVDVQYTVHERRMPADTPTEGEA